MEQIVDVLVLPEIAQEHFGITQRQRSKRQQHRSKHEARQEKREEKERTSKGEGLRAEKGGVKKG